MLWRWGGRSNAQSRHRATNLTERVWDRPRGPRVLICTCCRMRLVEVKRSRCSLISFVETSQISWSGKPWIGYTWQDSERGLHAGSAAGSLYYYKFIHIVHIHPLATVDTLTKHPGVWSHSLPQQHRGSSRCGSITQINERKKNKCLFFYQQTLIDEESISRHLLKLLVREVRLAVGNELTDVVLPTDLNK